MGALQERITTTTKGSITSVQAIYVPADDLTDPAPATSFAHLDATTVLSRQIAELGIYPAVDPLDPRRGCSTRGSLANAITRLRVTSRKCCSSTSRCRTSSPSSAWTNWKRTSLSLRARGRSSAFSQPFHVAEVFTGSPGKLVGLEDTIEGFSGIINGDYDHLPEAAFYMVGTIEEAVEKGKKLMQEAA